MRIVFFGTPGFAVESLKQLLEAGFDVPAAVTAPDKPANRGQKLTAPPVKDFAVSKGLRVLQPVKLKDQDFLNELKSLKADAHVVVAFRMLPESVWDMPPKGTYNLHASLLPQYRGAAPINWAIINGETKTGATIFKLRHEIDTGGILLQKELDVHPDETAGEVHDRLMVMGAQLLTEAMALVEEGKANTTDQQQLIKNDLKPAPKIFKEDCKINWGQPAKKVHDFIRGLSPFPTAFTSISQPNGEEVMWKIYRSRMTEYLCNEKYPKVMDGRMYFPTADFWLEILELQAPGKKRMQAQEFIKGLREDVSSMNVLD